MIEVMQGLPQWLDGFTAKGTVTKEDYEQVLVPALDAARREGRRLRFLYELGSEFGSFTPGAAWEDAKIGLQSQRLFDGCAVVTDHAWIRESTKLASFLMPCPVRIFDTAHREDAIAWLRTLPESPAITHRLMADAGVIVVEVRQALRAQDFDALAATADAWIEAHGELRGIVIHARGFPGWENLGSLVRHVRFVRDHQRKVERVALSADTPMASLVPRIAEHFVTAEVKRFDFAALDSAIAWARGASVQARNAPPTEEGASHQRRV